MEKINGEILKTPRVDKHQKALIVSTINNIIDWINEQEKRHEEGRKILENYEKEMETRT